MHSEVRFWSSWSIGNLTLVNKRLNPAMSNGPWEKKRAALSEHSVLHLNKEILQEWDVPLGSLTESSLADSDKSVRVPLPDSLYAGGPPSYAPAQDGVVVRLYDTTGSTLAMQLWILDDATGWYPLTSGRVPAWQPVNPYPMGLVNPAIGEWHLRDAAGKVETFYYGNPGDVPFMGDWDCDGIDTPGLYRQVDGYVYLRNSNTQGIADTKFYFGNRGDTPLAGDFDGDGCDTVSVYRPTESRVFIINELGFADAGLGAPTSTTTSGTPETSPSPGTSTQTASTPSDCTVTPPGSSTTATPTPKTISTRPPTRSTHALDKPSAT